MLRRLLSILLFAATLLPLIAPILSMRASAELLLPACCRRDGTHHCAMSADERAVLMGDSASNRLRVSAVCEVYPHGPSSLGAVPLSGYVPGMNARQTAGLLQEPAAALQAECLRRISFDRSRQKRGPPASFLFR